MFNLTKPIEDDDDDDGDGDDDPQQEGTVHYMIAKRWSEAVQPRQLAFKPFVVIVATATNTLIAAIAAAITAIG
ncbi:unnamed protein product [Lampetra planeri]